MKQSFSSLVVLFATAWLPAMASGQTMGDINGAASRAGTIGSSNQSFESPVPIVYDPARFRGGDVTGYPTSTSNGIPQTTTGTNGFVGQGTDQFGAQQVPANRFNQQMQGTQAQRPDQLSRMPAKPSDFELFVEDQVGHRLPRFGETLLIDGAQTFAPATDTVVPPDYTLQPGDELLLRTTGPLETDLRLLVDRSGRIHLPKVGAVSVAGVPHEKLKQHLESQFSKRFKGFELSVTIGQLHGIRVYVSGFAQAPGSYTLGSLSTLVNAVMASGGPSAGGSFRNIELRRGKEVVSTFDLYDLLRWGDKSKDVVLQNEDVVNIGAAGPQVAIFGSVNEAAIYEAKEGETLADLVRFAGGLSSVADSDRFAVARLKNRDGTVVDEGQLEQAGSIPLERGDIYRVFSSTTAMLPLDRQSRVVKIEGEVKRPGEYVMKPGSTVNALLEQAGGLTERAYVFGTEFNRESVRKLQQLNYERALQEFELTVATTALTSRAATAEEALQRSQELEQIGKLVARMRQVKPQGRMVLGLAPNARTLPDLPLENGDRVYIPARPTTVQVFGSVYNTGSYLFQPKVDLGKYLAMAGGVRRGADDGAMFVIRADGSAKSNRQSGVDVEDEDALPGDTVFVPDEMNKTTVMQHIKDFGTLFYQFGLGAAGLKILFGL